MTCQETWCFIWASKCSPTLWATRWPVDCDRVWTTRGPPSQRCPPPGPSSSYPTATLSPTHPYPSWRTSSRQVQERDGSRLTFLLNRSARENEDDDILAHRSVRKRRVRPKPVCFHLQPKISLFWGYEGGGLLRCVLLSNHARKTGKPIVTSL